jgi:hypothetical protein
MRGTLPGRMLDRLWWFLSGLLAGGLITVRALGRRPRREDLRRAATGAGADMLGLAARLIRPGRRG